MTSEDIEKIRFHIERHDSLISLFHMEIIDFIEGSATVRMTVRENHLNAASVCHGGVLFALADVAFALASNSHGTLSLAIDMSISFLKSIQPGETVTAHCSEKHGGRSTGTYIVELKDAGGRLVALVKATAFRTEKNIV